MDRNNKILLIIFVAIGVLIVGIASNYQWSEPINKVIVNDDTEKDIIETGVGQSEETGTSGDWLASPPVGININSNDHMAAKGIVNLAIEKYEERDQDFQVLKNYLGFKVNNKVERYIFVWDMKTQNIWSHPDSDLLGKKVFELITPTPPPNHINSELLRNGEAVMMYQWTNPETSLIDTKTTYMKLHDGLVFSSGYFGN